MKMITRILIALSLLLGASQFAAAQSPSHAYINTMRSSTVSHYYVGIGVDGEFGDYIVNETIKDDDGKVIEKKNDKATWQGYGVRNELGIEFLKFLQFSVGHSSLHLRRTSDSSENINGSRMNAGVTLNFYAPLGNLQAGGGLLGSRVNYHRQSESGGFYGSGYFYTLGVNYFMTPQISLYGNARQIRENLVKISGSPSVDNITTTTNSVGFGFNIWL